MMGTGKFLKIKLGGDADVVRLREERKDRAGLEAKLAEAEAYAASGWAEAGKTGDEARRQIEDLEAKLVELEAHYEQRGVKLTAALYATVNALDTMYRVAKAYAQPTGTSIDGESQMRYPTAVREEAKARELFEPILRALYEGREHKP